ncbi:DUF4251 domain-containing protein [Aquimarina mytili]|uniref:DUF4251 domain-containing protein n=1 Tax=Aquimarina mytili TaxID=874423 RepID=A0A937A0U9_9FLAO|nr:DUF4251 domain-containing protein [Aquimarina mytili]MBL0682955.1 DUF4251 domain-containing protein [Aquimarina mytili]
MKNIIFLTIVCCLLLSCSGAKNNIITEAQIKALDDIVAKKTFQIESLWANPLTTNSITSFANSGLLPPGSTVSNINLIGNPNYLKMHGDSISMYLPYFGEQRIATNYNRSDAAIEYDGKPDEIKIIKNNKKQTYQIYFAAKTDRDTYEVYVTLFPNLNSTIDINSVYRTTISYRGTVSKTKLPPESTVTIQ